MKPTTIKLLLICLVACPILFTSCMYSKKQCQKSYAKVEKETFDVIIVPGAPMDSKSLSRVLKPEFIGQNICLTKELLKILCTQDLPFIHHIMKVK